MIRVIIYLIIVAACAFGAVWLADRPGEVVITWPWFDYRLKISLLTTTFALIALIVAAILLWSLIRTIWRSPRLLGRFVRNRRGERGYMAISRGLIAVGSGDMRAARRYTDEANRLAPSEPLAMLLTAQTAQLTGDSSIAERNFRTMAGRGDTKLIGLHGLYIEAKRREDLTAAKAYAEEAAAMAPALAWAGTAVLAFRCVAGDWIGALERLDLNLRSRLIDRTAYRRQRAVLLTARALNEETSNAAAARDDALAALKLEPSLVPAAALAGRLLSEAGKRRKAERVLERAWQANPHPELAAVYTQLSFGNSARDRLARAEALAQKAPGNVEGAIAVARAALDAQEFTRARAALEPLVGAPTQRVALLMAAIEQREHGDEGRAREWVARAVHCRRDPAWTADGIVSDRWLPVSPVSGQLDAFEWKVPVEQMGVSNEDIAMLVTRQTSTEPPREPKVVEVPASETRAVAVTARDAEPAPVRRRPPAPPPGESVIPLVHAPDDPGAEAGTEPHEPPAATKTESLGRLTP